MTTKRLALHLVASAIVATIHVGPASAHKIHEELNYPPIWKSCAAGQKVEWFILFGDGWPDPNGWQLPQDCWSWGDPGTASHATIRLNWRDGSYDGGSVARCAAYNGNASGSGHELTHVSDRYLAQRCYTSGKFVTTPKPDRRNLGGCCPKVANPVNPANGNKYQVDVDYQGTSDFPLTWERYYNSQDTTLTGLGGWRHSFSRGLEEDRGLQTAYDENSADHSDTFDTHQAACEQGWPQIRARSLGLAMATATYANGTCTLSDGNRILGTLPIYEDDFAPPANPPLIGVNIIRPDGSSRRFNGAGPTFTPAQGVTGSLVKTAMGYTYTDNDIVEEYDSSLRLVSARNRAGVIQTVTYGSLGFSVRDSFGRTLTVTRDQTTGRIIGVIDPDGKQYSYAYLNGQLSTVTGPDNRVRRYEYGENTTFARALTGITDESGNRFATWAYDAMGRANLSEHFGGIDRTTIAFNLDGTATVTDSLNTSRNYSFQKINSEHKVAGVTQPCLPSCGTSTASTTYDANGFVDLQTDFNGNITDYTYNSRGLEESRTEAFGTPLARTITTQWHATYRLPLQIDEPGRRTTYTYDGSGNRLTETVLDTVTNASRITTWTYTTFGRVDTVDGPRTDVSDVTDYDHDTSGNLIRITNALGQITRITSHDAHGNPLTVIDPNGVTTTLTYDLRQRLKTRAVGGKTTTFDYDGVGQLDRVTLPDGAYLDYTYDAAHRLTDIQDNLGNKIHYTLDALGNRTSEEVRDPANDLKRKQSQVFDALSRLSQVKDANGAVVTQYGYDAQGNRTSQVDYSAPGTGHTTTFTPDALNRAWKVQDAAGGFTEYGYNALDQLTSVKDPKTLTTTYTLNALGDLSQQQSPDTGSASYTFDAAGNRTSRTDARGVTVNYRYDALNRLTLVDYPGTAEDVSYSYDSTSVSNGIGRLTGITDESGATTLQYDARGNVTQERRVSGAATHVTGYEYDAADRLTKITYPTGRSVQYTRNSIGQVSKVETTVGTSTVTVAQNIAYLPFGGIKSYELANGITVNRTHDQDYRVTEIKSQGTGTVQHLSYGYDLRGNIELLDDLVTPARNQSFSYDDLSRLVSADGGYGLLGYSYDATGNRLSATRDSNPADSYSYPGSSHRLASISGPNAASFAYDAAGAITATGSGTLAYNQAHRATTITEGANTVTAGYNAAGQRFRKTANGVTTSFHYDRSGHLLAEVPDSGLLISRDYLWLEGLPLAVASERRIPDVHVDNASPGFSTTGAWSTASGSGQYGASYAKRGPAVEVPGEQVVDDADSGASYTGNWVPGGSCGTVCPPLLTSVVSSEAPYGSTFHRSSTSPAGSAAPVFTWTQALSPGRYRVYVRWVPITGSGMVTYAVTHSGGTSTHPINQSLSSSGWYSLGSHEFNSTSTITLTPDPGVTAVADAIKLVPIENVDADQASWAATGEAGDYEVYVRWPSVAGVSNAAPFSIAHAGGTSSFSLDQTANAATWNQLGTSFSFSSPSQGIRLNAVWDSTVLADAIHFVPIAATSHRTNLAYAHPDHLGTIQKMTDASQAVVWDAAYEPFGEASITKTANYENPLRFPGQYEDEETGVYQNWNREYLKGIGRYAQSDPIGLAGGINTYGYALANPVGVFDRNGLETEAIVGGRNWYEHAATRIDGTVYSNGRYPVPGNEPVLFGTVGPNVLSVEDASKFFETSGACDTCGTKGYVLNLTTDQEKKIKDYYERLVKESKPHPIRKNWHVLPMPYLFLGNNCADLVSRALRQGLPWYYDALLFDVISPADLEVRLRSAPGLVKETRSYP